ncbi:MAG: hypothetical protein ACOX02_00305 [Acholeplasmatales bacterium]
MSKFDFEKEAKKIYSTKEVCNGTLKNIFYGNGNKKRGKYTKTSIKYFI